MKYRLVIDHKASVHLPQPWYRVEECVNGVWKYLDSGYEASARRMFEHVTSGGRLDPEVVDERESAGLRQFKEWAEPQIVTHGDDVIRIRHLEAALQEIVDKYDNDDHYDPAFITKFAADIARSALETEAKAEAAGGLT